MNKFLLVFFSLVMVSCLFNKEEKVVEIDEAICQGCGVCTCVCPRQIIDLSYYEDGQIMSKIDALLDGE